jgi:hypothetical protein
MQLQSAGGGTGCCDACDGFRWRAAVVFFRRSCGSDDTRIDNGRQCKESSHEITDTGNTTTSFTVAQQQQEHQSVQSNDTLSPRPIPQSQRLLSISPPHVCLLSLSSVALTPQPSAHIFSILSGLPAIMRSISPVQAAQFWHSSKQHSNTQREQQMRGSRAEQSRAEQSRAERGTAAAAALRPECPSQSPVGKDSTEHEL